MTPQDFFYAFDAGRLRGAVQDRYWNWLQKRYDCSVWRTKDNRLIPYTIMRDSHLQAAFNLIKQSCIKAMNSNELEGFKSHHRKYHFLFEEMRRRGMEVEEDKAINAYFFQHVLPFPHQFAAINWERQKLQMDMYADYIERTNGWRSNAGLPLVETMSFEQWMKNRKGQPS